jgi:hypothetical protein
MPALRRYRRYAYFPANPVNRAKLTLQLASDIAVTYGLVAVPRDVP